MYGVYFSYYLQYTRASNQNHTRMVNCAYLSHLAYLLCSSEFKKYKKYLKRKQAKVADDTGVPRSDVIHNYYNAFAGNSMMLTDEQAAKMREREDVADVVEDKKVTLDYITDDNSSNSPRRLTESTPAGGVEIGRAHV